MKYLFLITSFLMLHEIMIAQSTKNFFLLNYNNKEIIIEEGQDIPLDTLGNIGSLKVSMAPYTYYEDQAISFHYPSNFSPEIETASAYSIATLSGNAAIIFIFNFSVPVKLDDLIDEMVEQFGKKNCTIEKLKMTIGNRTLKGKRINVSLLSQILTYEMMTIETNDNNNVVIAFQNILNENGSQTDESIQTLEMIKNSIHYK